MTTLCSPLQIIRTVSCFCLTHTNRLIGTLHFENSSLQQTCNGNIIILVVCMELDLSMKIFIHRQLMFVDDYLSLPSCFVRFVCCVNANLTSLFPFFVTSCKTFAIMMLFEKRFSLGQVLCEYLVSCGSCLLFSYISSYMYNAQGSLPPQTHSDNYTSNANTMSVKLIDISY